MTESLILLVALLVAPVILLFAFAGCVGEDPRVGELEKKVAEQDKEKAEQEKKEAEEAEAAKYDSIVKNAPNLVSYWRLDDGVPETGDTKARDSAPVAPLDGEYKRLLAISRGQTGALNSDPQNKAVDFLGTEGYVEVPYDGLRNPPFSFSVEVWMKPALSSNEPQVMIGSYELDGGNLVRGFVLDMLHSPAPRVRARLGNGSPSPAALEASLGDGSEHQGWRHVVMTYSGASKTLTLYVNADDGKPDAQAAGVIYTPVTGTTTPLRIAAGQHEGVAAGLLAPGSLSRYFAGRLDEVALYREALDGPTIRKHFLAA
jgi:hypothetical protein